MVAHVADELRELDGVAELRARMARHEVRHEVLLLAKDKDTDPSQLKEIVEEVNLTDAVSTDFLSNHVYEYDSDEDTVTIVV